MRIWKTGGRASGGQLSFRDQVNRNITNPNGLWLRIERKYPYVEAFYSRDGKRWHSVDNYRGVILAKDLFAGLQVTAGPDSAAIAVDYDRVSITPLGDGSVSLRSTPVKPCARVSGRCLSPTQSFPIAIKR